MNARILFMRLPSPLLTFARAWRKDDVTHLAAALAYYAMFSLPALLLLVIAVGGVIVGDELSRAQAFALIDRSAAGVAGDVLKSTVTGISLPGRGLAMTIVGTISLIAGGTAIIREAQGALRKICGPGDKNRASFLARVFRAVLAIPVVSVLLVAALVSSTALGLARDRIAAYVAVPPLTIGAANAVLTFLTLVLLIGALYALLIPRRMPAHALAAGAGLAAVLLVLSRSLFGTYASVANLGAAYGVAASLLVLLMWTYVAAVIFLTGGELAAVMAGKKAPRHG